MKNAIIGILNMVVIPPATVVLGEIIYQLTDDPAR
jgi:hypothetical protein